MSTMGMKTFEWKRVKVEVCAMGEDRCHWHAVKKYVPVMRYEVSVAVGPAKHVTSAWGSIAEYEKYSAYLKSFTTDFAQGKEIDKLLDHKGIAAMVVDELASALADPDDFLESCVGEQKGRAAIEALRNAEKTILGACALGPALAEAAEQIREEGLL